MEKLLRYGCLLVTGLLVLSQYAECMSTSTVSQTTPTSTQTSSEATTTAAVTSSTQSAAQMTSTESITDFINRKIFEGIRKGLLDLMEAGITNGGDSETTTSTASITTSSSAQTTASSVQTTSSSAQTTASSPQTTASSGTTVASQSTPATVPSSTTMVQTTTASASRKTACPQGQYDSRSKTVTFTMEDRECEIKVYLSKPPRGDKGRKGKENKGKKEKKGKGKKDRKGKTSRETGHQRFVEKNISVGPIPGTEFDKCPEVTTRTDGKDKYFIETSECLMYVAKDKKKGKGKDRSSAPLMFTRAL